MSEPAEVEPTAAASEPPVDSRVAGAIESLNTAIENLNTVENTREACVAAAARASALVKEELAALDAEGGALERLVLPFLAARSAAQEAIDNARAAEATYRCACAAVQSVREDERAHRFADRATARLAKAAAEKTSKEAKQECRRLERGAEARAIKLGQARPCGTR